MYSRNQQVGASWTASSDTGFGWGISLACHSSDTTSKSQEQHNSPVKSRTSSSVQLLLSHFRISSRLKWFFTAIHLLSPWYKNSISILRLFKLKRDQIYPQFYFFPSTHIDHRQKFHSATSKSVLTTKFPSSFWTQFLLDLNLILALKTSNTFQLNS